MKKFNVHYRQGNASIVFSVDAPNIDIAIEDAITNHSLSPDKIWLVIQVY